MIYVQLFLSFLQIGAFSFGGGYAAMPLIQSIVVDQHKWLSVGEFTNLITISQMTPGPIAINSATFVGNKIGGPLGGVAATFGCIFPSCVIVTIIAYFYMKYRKLEALQIVLKTLRPAVVALIATAGVAILTSAFFGESAIVLQNMNIPMVIIFIISAGLLMKFKTNPILIMVLAGVSNVIYQFIVQLFS